MVINPILPIWVMAVISVALLVPMRKGVFNYIRQVLIVLILFAINLRPMLDSGEYTEVKRDYKVLFVVDNTISMLAEDGRDGTIRMDDVKSDINNIMNRLPGASYSLMKFDSEARQIVPFSTDDGMTRQAVKSLNGQSRLYAYGTSLAILRDPLITILSQFKEDRIILFLFTDGENTSDEDILPLNSVAKLISGGAVLGYGTQNGGKMRAADYVGDEERDYIYYYDDNYNRRQAISVIDEDNLKKMASEMQIPYVHMDNVSNITPVLEQVNKAVEDAGLENVKKHDGYTDIYYWFAIPLVLILIFDFIYYRKKIWKAPKAV